MRGATVQCSHEGNPDFYGLGIRVGIYLQLTTAILAKYLRPEAAPGNLNTNAVFLLALFVALATATFSPGLGTEETVILLQLCFGFLLSVLSLLGGHVSADRPKPSKGVIRPPPVASFFRLTLNTAICAYAVWFWFIGINNSHVPGCSAYIFVVARASIFGGVRILYQVQAFVIFASLAVLLLWQLLLIFWVW
ncbi:MAG: hypothetical protein Q9218_006373 [Villophora microphyllina]